jgi:hypothetical protein
MADDATDWMLTTVDNPFNPFTQFKEWFAWDRAKGYDTPGLLARVAFVPEDLPEADLHAAVQDGIDEIVRENISGMHRKVSRESFDASQPQE